jgi:hypothetical protein
MIVCRKAGDLTKVIRRADWHARRNDNMRHIESEPGRQCLSPATRFHRFRPAAAPFDAQGTQLSPDLLSRALAHQVAELKDQRVRDGVVHAGAVGPALEHASFVHGRQMTRNVGLVALQFLCQLIDAMLARFQQLQQAEPRGLATGSGVPPLRPSHPVMELPQTS